MWLQVWRSLSHDVYRGLGFTRRVFYGGGVSTKQAPMMLVVLLVNLPARLKAFVSFVRESLLSLTRQTLSSQVSCTSGGA